MKSKILNAAPWVLLLIGILWLCSIANSLRASLDPRQRAKALYAMERQEAVNDSIFLATYDSLRRAGGMP